MNENVLHIKNKNPLTCGQINLLFQSIIAQWTTKQNTINMKYDIFQTQMLGKTTTEGNFRVDLMNLKGRLTGFFLGLIVFMGCSLACVHAWFF